MSKQETKNNIQMGIIVILLIIIAIMGFFLGKTTNKVIGDNDTKVEQKTEEVKVSDIKMTVIDDKRCTDCQTNAIVEQLKLVPSLSNVAITIKDFSDEGVSKYLKENNINALPAVIFNTNNVDTQLNKYLVALSKGEFSLQLGARFDPFAEICENKIDDNNDGKIDCEDPTCSNTPICRSAIKGKLDVFLMGYCPFGEIAAKAMPKIKEVLKDGVNIDVHFIASKMGEGDTANSFQSLHGVSEAEEDIRQLCIKKYYGIETLVSYFQDRYANTDRYGKVTDKPSIAYKANNIDETKINNCIEKGEGAKLLEEDIKLAEELGVNGSPTWLANNKYKFGGIDAKAIIENFCKYNKDLEGCNIEIEDTNITGATPSCNN